VEAVVVAAVVLGRVAPGHDAAVWPIAPEKQIVAEVRVRVGSAGRLFINQSVVIDKDSSRNSIEPESRAASRCFSTSMIFSSVNRLFFILVLLLLSENFQSYLVDFIGGTSGSTISHYRIVEKLGEESVGHRRKCASFGGAEQESDRKQ
jgi:hypothetical protein